jgi:perosamine synthetase
MIGSLPRLRLYTTPRLYLQVLREVLRGHTTAGDDVGTLEREIQRRVNVAHAIAMPLARVGIYIAVKHLIRPGQKVILSPYTIADVINMVICAGGVPVFADIDRSSCNISTDAVARLLNDDIGAVLVTHFYGQMADIEALRRLCTDRNVPLIEDAAQALGARLGRRAAGTFGKAGIFSFGMYKNVNSFYGGMVVTEDEALAAAIRSEIATWPYQSTTTFVSKVISGLITDIATWPPIFRAFSFRVFRWAFVNRIDVINDRLKIDVNPEMKQTLPESYRCRMTPLQARLILSQLHNIEPHAELRRKAAEIYHAGLADIPELIIAPLRHDGSHIYWYYPIQYRDRWDLVAHVMRHGRDITMSYHRNCAAMPCFAAFARDCPNTQATADSLIYLPTYPRYSEAEIHRTIKAIRSYFGR